MPGLGYLEHKVIVGRNPGYHPGELLLIKALHAREVIEHATKGPRPRDNCGGRQGGAVDLNVAWRWYDSMQCVVILSTQSARGQPSRSVADQMQGADYDGDKVKVIWDERFTEGFADFAPPSYSDAVMHDLGSAKIAHVKDPDERAFEYFLEVVRRPNTAVGTGLELQGYRLSPIACGLRLMTVGTGLELWAVARSPVARRPSLVTRCLHRQMARGLWPSACGVWPGAYGGGHRFRAPRGLGVHCGR